MLVVFTIMLVIFGLTLGEWAFAVCAAFLGFCGASKLGGMAKDEAFLIPWTRVSLTSLCISGLAAAFMASVGTGYWQNYVGVLCYGIWGVSSGMAAGFGHYSYRGWKVQKESRPLRRDPVVVT